MIKPRIAALCHKALFPTAITEEKNTRVQTSGSKQKGSLARNLKVEKTLYNFVHVSTIAIFSKQTDVFNKMTAFPGLILTLLFCVSRPIARSICFINLFLWSLPT